MDCSSKGPWFKSGCPLSYLFFSASVFRLLFGEWAYWCIGRVYHSKSSSGTPCWVSYMYIWDCDNQFCSCILINRVDFIKTPTAALSKEAQVSVLHVYMSVYVGMCIVWRGSRDMHVHVHVLVMYIHTCTCTCTQCLLCTCSLMMCSWISLCLSDGSSGDRATPEHWEGPTLIQILRHYKVLHEFAIILPKI